MAIFVSYPSTTDMPGTYITSRSARVLAPEVRIISSVMSVTGTGVSSTLSACWEAVVMVAPFPLFNFSMRSAKRSGSERVGV